MAVRSTMAAIILELRGLTDATDGETTVNGVPFWSDDQLQAILDNYRIDALDTELTPAPQMVSGVSVYYRYYFPDELTTSLETGFIVTDENGNSLAGWTYAPGTRYILFPTDQVGHIRLITGNAYNLRKAAARVWFTKASQRTALIDWKAGGQTLSEDQEYQHCMGKFMEFAGAGGVGAIIPGVPSGTRSIRLHRAGYAVQTPDLVEMPYKGLDNDINGPISS